MKNKKKPRISKANKELLLQKALGHINSAPYQVSLRWVFYRVLEDGLLSGKDSYERFKRLILTACKERKSGWNPGTLADELRRSILRSGDYRAISTWLASVQIMQCSLDEWYNQPNYVEVWYGAKSMTDQFNKLTSHVCLVPFGDDVSMRYKWEIAKHLENAADMYRKPIKIVYFGDFDPEGKTIPYAALNDVKKWCSASFDFINGGLTHEQAETFNIPQDPDRPGAFQWEAVGDQAAKEIISKALAPLLDYDQFNEIRRIEDAASEKFHEVTGEILAKLQEKY